MYLINFEVNVRFRRDNFTQNFAKLSSVDFDTWQNNMTIHIEQLLNFFGCRKIILNLMSTDIE